MGWLGWRSDDDEELIKAISAACNFDRTQRANFDKESNLSHSPGSLHSDDSLQFTNEINQTEKKVGPVGFNILLDGENSHDFFVI